MIQVIIGSIIGSIIRVFLSQFNGRFPTVTLSINIIGSLLLGMISQMDQFYLLLGTGMMGGLTTFSTFTVDFLNLLKDEKREAVFYLLFSTILPLLAFFTGMLIL